MKLSETILFSLAVAGFIIGVHQSFTVGITESYWLFMLTAALLLAYQLVKRKNQAAGNPKPPAAPPETARPVRKKSSARR